MESVFGFIAERNIRLHVKKYRILMAQINSILNEENPNIHENDIVNA